MQSTRIRAVVTGHSRGLGEAIAEALLVRGIPVLALARRPNQALAHRHGDALAQVALDLADPQALARWIAEGTLARLAADADRLLLVNNAGTVQPIGPLSAQSPAEVAAAVTLNVAAPLMLAAALCSAHAGSACAGEGAPAAAASPEPATGSAPELRIMHVSSGAGRNAYPGWSVYCATKAALDHHARAAALDRTPGLRIESLAPGVIDTGMQAEIRATDEARFPMRDRFVALDRDRALARPADAAARVVEHLLSARFGQQPVTNLREL